MTFDKNFNLFKVFFVLIFIAIIGSIILAKKVHRRDRLILERRIIMSARKSGKITYEIKVNNFRGSQDYITTEYTRDKETGCISFKDEFGVKQIVCNNYTISEY